MKNERQELKRISLFACIIESPHQLDFFSDSTEGDMLKPALELAHIHFDYRIAVSRKIFEDAIAVNTLAGNYRQPHAINHSLPVLHISAKGNEDGLILTNKDVITWQELRDMIEPINKILRGNLLLCISGCYPGYAQKLSETFKDASLWGIIGNAGVPTLWEFPIGFAVLYHLVAHGYRLEDAVIAMKLASGNPNFHLLAYNEKEPALSGNDIDRISTDLANYNRLE